MDPIADALLAVMASIAGDTTGALDTSRPLSTHVRTAARRHRQVVEIAGLLVAGADDRADGLAVLHRTEFDEDTLLVARMTRIVERADGASRSPHIARDVSRHQLSTRRRESNPQPSDP